MLLDNLHTNLDNRVEDLKIRSRGDNRCESAKSVVKLLIELPAESRKIPRLDACNAGPLTNSQFIPFPQQSIGL